MGTKKWNVKCVEIETRYVLKEYSTFSTEETTNFKTHLMKWRALLVAPISTAIRISLQTSNEFLFLHFFVLFFNQDPDTVIPIIRRGFCATKVQMEEQKKSTTFKYWYGLVFRIIHMRRTQVIFNENRIVDTHHYNRGFYLLKPEMNPIYCFSRFCCLYYYVLSKTDHGFVIFQNILEIKKSIFFQLGTPANKHITKLCAQVFTQKKFQRISR